MAELKTQPTKASVRGFIDALEDEGRRKDCRALVKLMREITGEPAVMWGPSIVGFGSYHYKTRSGQEADWFLTGFSPRKRDLTLYIMAGFEPFAGLLEKLGRHKTGKSCLYLRGLDDVDLPTLHELVRLSVERTRAGAGFGGGC